MDSLTLTLDADKNPLKHFNATDVLGLAQLAVQATTGVVGVVEGVHQSVRGTLGLPAGQAPGRAAGITGLVYQLVRGATQLAGAGTDAALSLLRSPDAAPVLSGADTIRREKFLAALNGVMGDHLVTSGSPFARIMEFRHGDQTLDECAPAVMAADRGKVVLLIHGLCMSDVHWRSAPAGGLGEALASKCGYTPVYLRYNSGLHVSRNGMELATRLEQLLAHWPEPIEQLCIVAHSMGGLLARSAVYYARQHGMRWPEVLKDLVFLGTPHHGAPLEQAGSWLDLFLGGIPYTRPFTALGRLRSAGITDLRYGHVLEEDWRGRDRFRQSPDLRCIVPLPTGVACHAVAATLTSQRGALSNHLIGDGLVPVRSALGQHREQQKSLSFAEPAQWVAYRTNHQRLLSSPEVAQKVVQWLT